MTDNHTLYSTAEFATWAFAPSRLLSQEAILFKAFFRPTAKTLEVGTGGGRILIALRDQGYTDLHGCDYVVEFIDEARKKVGADGIDFQVQDATQLGYADSTFEQLIYLQQILSFIEDSEARCQAFDEAYRICLPGGTLVLSFLALEGRPNSALHRRYDRYLTVFRRVTGSKRGAQYLPWLRRSGKLNKSALLDRPPFTYWFTVDELVSEIKRAGFELLGIGSATQVEDERLPANVEAMKREPQSTILYVVARKV